MRRSASVVVALTIALGFVAFTLGGTSAATPPVKKISISSTRCPGGHIFCYKAAAVTVKKGTKVVWTNADWIAHTVTRCTKVACGVDGGTGKQTGLASPSIGHNKTYVFTFTKPGTYRYFCKPHGYDAMHATITVTG